MSDIELCFETQQKLPSENAEAILEERRHLLALSATVGAALAGDDALRFIARYLKESMRSQDFVARIGGDEFVIILPGTTRESAAMLAERCRRALAAATWPKRPLTFSIGISSLEGRQIKSAALVSEADQALYRAKARGRNQVSLNNDMADEDLLVSANYVPRVPSH